jgi:hypothetical protein
MHKLMEKYFYSFNGSYMGLYKIDFFCDLILPVFKMFKQCTGSLLRDDAMNAMRSAKPSTFTW